MTKAERAVGRGENKETPEVKQIAKITQNIWVVEINGKRQYEVKWKAGTKEVKDKDGNPAIKVKGKDTVTSYFDSIEQIIHQHERVIEGYLGTEIKLGAEKVLTIPGEAQKMEEISHDLFSLIGKYVAPLALTPKSSSELKSAAIGIRKKIGVTKNEYKLKASHELEQAILSDDKTKNIQLVFDSNINILQRTEQILGLIEGTTNRLQTCNYHRDQWESTISEIFINLAGVLNSLRSGGYSTAGERETLARRISGKDKSTVIGRLNEISGPEYWQRIQSPEVKRIAKLGELFRAGNIEGTERILEEAIVKLERVVKDKQDRDLANREIDEKNK